MLSVFSGVMILVSFVILKLPFDGESDAGRGIRLLMLCGILPYMISVFRLSHNVCFMEKKPSIDPGFLVPVALGVLSILGIIIVLLIGRANALRPSDEPVNTETPFRYIYLGTEPGLSTLTPEPTETPIFIEPPAVTETPNFNEPSFPTFAPTNAVFPTPPFVRTSIPTASETIPAVLSKFDDTYFEILYNGDWTSQTSVTGAYMNTLHISLATENYASFTFVGQQVIITFQAGPSLGSILINLDGMEFEVTQSNSRTQLVEWRSPVLVMGTHEITIEHLSGGSINLDSITIPDLSTPTPTATP